MVEAFEEGVPYSGIQSKHPNTKTPSGECLKMINKLLFLERTRGVVHRIISVDTRSFLWFYGVYAIISSGSRGCGFMGLSFPFMQSQKKFPLGTGPVSILGTSACLGADVLLKLLGNYCRNADIRTSITVGVVGKPHPLYDFHLPVPPPLVQDCPMWGRVVLSIA